MLEVPHKILPGLREMGDAEGLPRSASVDRRCLVPKAFTVAGDFDVLRLSASRRGADGPAQDERNDPADAQDFDFERGLDRGRRVEALGCAGSAVDGHLHGRSRRQTVRIGVHFYAVAGAEPQVPGVLLRHEPQRQDAHPDQVRPVDALEARSENGADAEQAEALGGPVRDDPVP